MKGDRIEPGDQLKMERVYRKMTIHEFGKENEELLVLFHPLGVHFDIFNKVVPILQKYYHLIIPAIPGFDPDEPKKDFTSVEQIADEIAAWIIDHHRGCVKCLYGCSMGGAITARLLAAGKINAECAVIDGGITPYPFWKPLTYLVGVRDFIMMEIGKHMSVKMLRSIFDPEKYTEDDLQYVKVCMRGMRMKTIWCSFYSCNNYVMPKSVSAGNCRIAYWYGADEKRARRRDIAYICKVFPDVQVMENAGMGHAEFFTLHSQAFCRKLMAWICLSTG